MARRGRPLEGRVALVVGGARGIGLVIAGLVARLGAAIALTGETMDEVERAYQRLHRIPGTRILGEALDPVHERALVRFGVRVTEHLGPPDLWIQTIPPDTESDIGISSTAEPEWWRLAAMLPVEAAQIALYHATTASVPALLLVVAAGETYPAPYTIARAAIDALVQQASSAWEPGHATLSLLEVPASAFDATGLEVEALDEVLERWATAPPERRRGRRYRVEAEGGGWRARLRRSR